MRGLAFECLVACSLINLRLSYEIYIRRRLATRLAPNLALGQPVVLSSVATCLDCNSFAASWRYLAPDGSETRGDGNKVTDGDNGTAFFTGMGCAETKAL